MEAHKLASRGVSTATERANSHRHSSGDSSLALASKLMWFCSFDARETASMLSKNDAVGELFGLSIQSGSLREFSPWFLVGSWMQESSSCEKAWNSRQLSQLRVMIYFKQLRHVSENA